MTPVRTEVPFTASDIWLFVSIGIAETNPPADLANVLFAGDTINKAVFTPAELRRGLSKLTRIGFVTDADGIFSLTERGRSIFDAARKRRRDWMSVRRDLEAGLGATRGPTDDPGFEDPQFPYPQLTDERIDDADREYRRRFREILAKLDGKPTRSRRK